MMPRQPQPRDPLTPFGDLRGTAVHDADGLLTGYLYGVLTETETGLVRYLDIELADQGRHALVPIGHARLEQSATGEPRIRLRAATLHDLQHIPTAAEPTAWQVPEQTRELLAAHGRLFRGDRYYAHPAFDHRGLYAGAHPIICEAQIPPRAVESIELLSESKHFRLARGEPDLRGSHLLDAERAAAGVIEDLLIDTSTLKVPYLVVHAEGAHFLIPVGYVELEQAAAVMPGLKAADLAALPHFDGLPLSRRAEEELLNAIERVLDARNPFLRVDFSNRGVVGT